MERRQKILLALAGVLVLIGILAVFALDQSSYEKFRLVEGEAGWCEQQYAECTCYGELIVLESYPPQYRCTGYEACQEIDRTVCP